MALQLENKIALITGGTRGIGLAIASNFIELGAKVIITARGKDAGAEAAKKLGDRSLFIACDVTCPKDVSKLIQEIEQTYSRLDIVVNNAGGAIGMATIDQMSFDDWKFVLNTNLNSVFLVSQAALKVMIPQGSGRIINMSSIESKQASPTFGHYTASKHAINGLTKTLAAENGVHGITVNAICPGLVMTDLIKEQMEATAKAKGTTANEYLSAYVQGSALKRPMELEEVSSLAAFLASDAASGITSTAISVDGGDAAF